MSHCIKTGVWVFVDDYGVLLRADAHLNKTTLIISGYGQGIYGDYSVDYDIFIPQGTSYFGIPDRPPLVLDAMDAHVSADFAEYCKPWSEGVTWNIRDLRQAEWDDINTYGPSA